MKNLGNLINLDKDLSKIAIIDETSRVTYKQLHMMSNYVAQELKNKGFVPGDRIGIRGVNTIGYIASYLGILKFGGIAVLINVKLPESQVDYIMHDSKCKILLDNPEVPIDVEAEFTSYNAELSDPAIIMYTSGSTNNPKGVILSHNHKWIIDQKSKIPNSEHRRAIVAAPLYHMNGLSNSETLIRSHATLILLKNFEPKKFLEKIAYHKVNSITSVPTMLSIILQEKELIDRLDLSCVKAISMASAPVSKSLFESLKITFPTAQLINAYGITEVSPGMFGRHPSLPTPEMSVGYPMNGIEYRIMNGILQVKSPSMFLKYNNLDINNLTEDGFFITNDLFRVDENGFYFFLGRADDMFVSGGNNIFPRQIESVIEDHPSIRSSAVIGLPDELKGTKPYAFVVGDISEELLKAHILKFLPPSHCPRKIWNVETLPLNSVNKVDKNLLKEKAITLIKNGNNF